MVECKGYSTPFPERTLFGMVCEREIVVIGRVIVERPTHSEGMLRKVKVTYHSDVQSMGLMKGKLAMMEHGAWVHQLHHLF